MTEKLYNPLHVLQYHHCQNYPPLGWLSFYPMPQKAPALKAVARGFHHLPCDDEQSSAVSDHLMTIAGSRPVFYGSKSTSIVFVGSTFA